VNDEPCWETPAIGNHSFSGGQAPPEARAANLLAGFQNFQTTLGVNGTVHAAATEERAVGRIHNGVYGLRGDVAAENLDSIRKKSFDGGGVCFIGMLARVYPNGGVHFDSSYLSLSWHPNWGLRKNYKTG
jgi:hypothetical protein